MSNNVLSHRYLTRIVLECESTLSIGSGERGWENENLIVRDVNGLPYIPGTSLAGVLRHALEKRWGKAEIEKVFGFQDDSSGQGSRILFSQGLLLGTDGKSVVEGIEQGLQDDPYYTWFIQLPERDHVRINEKGVATKHAKFLEQLVFRGTRFVFEMELRSFQDEKDIFDSLVMELSSPTFRLGSGTRNGLGALKIVKLEKVSLDLTKEAQLEAYLQRSSSLSQDFFTGIEASTLKKLRPEGWEVYSLEIRAKDFFIFGSGNQEYLESEESWLDQLPKKESCIHWDEEGKNPTLEPHYLIPGTSIKGALAHRVAYHYHLLCGEFIENEVGDLGIEEKIQLDIEQVLAEIDPGIQIEDLNFAPNSNQWKYWIDKVENLSLSNSKTWLDYLDGVENLGDPNHPKIKDPDEGKNAAVKTLFGYAKIKRKNGVNLEETGARGKIIIPDVYLPRKDVSEKIFTHVAIDRFTGGALDGALFEEQAISCPKTQKLDIWVEVAALQDPNIRKAFEASLDDLVSGRLALGGNTAKGHGVFEGSYKKEIDSTGN
ncbi:MAG: RAMP superfamily CRISPR-associated protein [Bacteroidota bacterium]